MSMVFRVGACCKGARWRAHVGAAARVETRTHAKFPHTTTPKANYKIHTRLIVCGLVIPCHVGGVARLRSLQGCALACWGSSKLKSGKRTRQSSTYNDTSIKLKRIYKPNYLRASGVKPCRWCFAWVLAARVRAGVLGQQQA